VLVLPEKAAGRLGTICAEISIHEDKIPRKNFRCSTGAGCIAIFRWLRASEPQCHGEALACDMKRETIRAYDVSREELDGARL
jgi:hypothetical protein